MAKAKVVGTRNLDFKDSNGNRICGLNVYVTRKEDGVIGEVSDKIFIRNDSQFKVPFFEFGREYDFVYDGFGRRQTLVDIKKVV